MRQLSNPRAFLAFLLFILSLVGPAHATVTEPNGLVVPLDSNNGEIQLYTFFQQRGEAIGWQKDGHTAPATFTPLCGFTAQFMLHQAGSNLGLGWYNSDPKNMNPPALNQIYTLIPAGSPVGTTIKSANIINDPQYKGGEIGFALIGGQTHYSEQRYNVSCGGCGKPGPWALAVIYQSILTPHAYYIGFEDGPVSNSSFNNDGDFNDDVYFISGVQCSGAGIPCATGKKGVCADGLTSCDIGGTLGCKQLNAPGLETCNGLDDDCNGTADDGAMCPNNQVCDRGQCVDLCGAGEFQCVGGGVCDNGVCVDMRCVGVKCPAAQVCHDGMCAAACDGVVCPNGQVCRVGRCIDPCAGVKCAMGQVCQNGVCLTGCGCQPCPMALACAKSGLCVDPLCINMNCAAGMFCKAGMCADNCDGAMCPRGQVCQMGQCIDFVPPDMLGLGAVDGESPSDDAFNDSTDDAGNLARAHHGCGCALGGARRDGGAGGYAIAFISLMAFISAGSFRRRRRRTFLA